MRPRSHVQEQESRVAFEQALSAEWVARPQTPDYGIDYEVEIFRHEKATPWKFAAQLKATDGIEAKNAQPSFSFSTVRLLQYLESALPVMLVLYDCLTRRIWYRWAQQIWREASTPERRKWHFQESVTISFTQRLDGIAPAPLEAEVRRESLRLGRSLPANHFLTLRLVYPSQPNAAALAQSHLCDAGIRTDVRFGGSGLEDAAVECDEEPDVLRLVTAGEEPLELPGGTKALGVTDEERAGSLVVVFAYLLATSGLPSTSLEIVAHLLEESPSIGPIGRFLLMLPSLAELFATAGRARDALHLAAVLQDRNPDDDLSLILATAAIGGSRSHRRQFRAIAEAALNVARSAPRRAALHYSLANSLCADGDYLGAIGRYRLAAVENPDYRARGYWWAELAGCLFQRERYRDSVRAYQLANFLGECSVPVQGLLGDALLHCGQFGDAYRELNDYLSTPPPYYPGLVISRAVAGILQHEFGRVMPRRQRASDDLMRQLDGNTAELNELIELAVSLDPLSASAWFNLASAFRNTGRDASTAALIAAALAPWDVEAWAMAATEWTSKSDTLELAAALVVEGFRLHGAELEAATRRVVRSASGTVEPLIELLRKTDAAARPFFNTERPVIVRICE